MSVEAKAAKAFKFIRCYGDQPETWLREFGYRDLKIEKISFDRTNEALSTLYEINASALVCPEDLKKIRKGELEPKLVHFLIPTGIIKMDRFLNWVKIKVLPMTDSERDKYKKLIFKILDGSLFHLDCKITVTEKGYLQNYRSPPSFAAMKVSPFERKMGDDAWEKEFMETEYMPIISKLIRLLIIIFNNLFNPPQLVKT